MTAYPNENETVQAAANKLMAALALHEDCRGTVTDALHDMWDAGHASAPLTPQQAIAIGEALLRLGRAALAQTN